MIRTSVRLASAVASVAAAAVLVAYRPAAPELPNSLSSPVTTTTIEQLVLVAAWLLAWAIVVVFFVHSRRLLGRDRPRRLRLEAVLLTADTGSAGRTRIASASEAPAFAPPFPLIVRERSERSGGWSSDGSAVSVRVALGCELQPPFIAVLGPLKIVAAGRRRRRLRKRAQELLAYLALHTEGAPTDELAAALWPNAHSDTARDRVWRSLSDARSQLGDVVGRANDRYVLDRQALTVDLDRFDELLIQANAGHPGDRESVLERALALVRGEPLAGDDFPWATGEVRHLRARIVGVLEEFGYHRLDAADPTRALAAAEQAIALDAYNESVHQLAMRAESALGLRQGIVDRYERLCTELDTQLGLEPERETRLLYRRLLSQDAQRHESTARYAVNSLNLR